MALTAEEKKALIAGMSAEEKTRYKQANTAREKAAFLGVIDRKRKDAATAEQIRLGLVAPKTDTQSQGTGTYKDVIKLTPDSAKLLLTQAAKDAQFIGTLSKADIADFIAKFQTEANKQMAIVIRQAQDSQKVGATPSDLVTSISNQVTKNFPSFFKADVFAKDYIWSKINFKNEKSLAGPSLTALAQARKVVSDFHVLGVSEKEIQIAAKQIAKGEKSVDDYTAEIQRVAMKEYPSLADRFKLDSTLTTKDIVSPVVNLLAKVWELPAGDIQMDNPYVMSYLNPTGADGKGEAPTLTDIYYRALKDPKRQKTIAANEEARQAATSLGQAWGAGV
jgi:hypothetical protein